MPTGIIVYNIILMPFLNIVPGYVAKLIIILVRESERISPLTNQKDMLPTIAAKEVTMIAPVIINIVNNTRFFIVIPYKIKHIYP